MKDRIACIKKWLARAEKRTQAALAAKNENTRMRRAASAEKLCRKALALCGPEAGENRNDTWYTACVYDLTVLLIHTDQADEALEFLEEHYCERGLSDESGRALACGAYYGGLLYEEHRCDKAAAVLAAVTEQIGADGWDKGTGTARTMSYPEAMGMGLGYAAAAFTESVKGEGYASPLFTAPALYLRRMQAKGMDVGVENITRALYFAASEQLCRACREPVSHPDVSSVTELAQACAAVSRESRKMELYLPASVRLKALAEARACRFADCAETCRETLELCSSREGCRDKSLQITRKGIAGDMNLLLCLLYYRAHRMDECVRYGMAALEAMENDVGGEQNLAYRGYYEVESEQKAVLQAEKAAIAHRTLALATFGQKGQEALGYCADHLKTAAELQASADIHDPFYRLSASLSWLLLAQMYKVCGQQPDADACEETSKQMGNEALEKLKDMLDPFNGEHKNYCDSAAVRRRLALRLGLLEYHAEWLRYEVILHQQPYVLSPMEEDNLQVLSDLYFRLGDCKRVLGDHQEAVDAFEKMRQCVNALEKRPRPLSEQLSERIAMADISEAACLVKLEKIPHACRVFRELDNRLGRTEKSDQSVPQEKVMLAYASRDVGLPFSQCAPYFRRAAESLGDSGENVLTAAELYNQEGICWYNSDPEYDREQENGDKKLSPVAQAVRMTLYLRNEIAAYEEAIGLLDRCPQDQARVLELRSSLMFNLGECHIRDRHPDAALADYHAAVDAFESLFASDGFAEKKKEEQAALLFQYGSCHKALADLYEEQEDNEACARELTQAVEVFGKLDSDAARNELAVCLNALGCIKYRLGDYRGNIEDVSRAIAIKNRDEGSEISVAIMLKNRSDAYRELGDFKSMQSDLSQSIELLDRSDLPEEMRSSFYGSHWFSMGVCQEGLHKAGKAADAYRRAARYMDNAPDSEENGISPYMKALCHFRRANCLCRREAQEFYGALNEYNHAIRLVEALPASRERDHNLSQLLASRGSLYEAFREVELAREDFRRAERLKKAEDGEEE